MKRTGWIVFIIALLWIAPCLALSETGAVGQPAPAIALTCADGREFSLQETLQEKRLAAVCLFGSQCGACQAELRAIEQAYHAFRDQVAVIGLSLDRTYDTEEVLARFAREQGLTFPLGRDPARTARFLGIRSYPALMLVDQSGNVVHVETGAQSSDHYAQLFSRYLGIAWTGTEWDGDIEAGNHDIVSLGKETARVDSIPYDSLENAVRGAVEYDKGASPYYRLLSQTEWKFAYFDSPAALAASGLGAYYCWDFDDSGWERIFVPSVWQTQGYDHPIYTNTTQKFAKNFGNTNVGYPRDLPKAPTVYNPVGLYRHAFEVPAEWAGRRVFINLEGVDSAFYLWINGIQAGYAEDSFTANEFDITEYVRFGETNVLTAQVYRWCDGSWIEDQDMFDLSGIFRDVYVYATPQVRVRDFSIVPDFDDTFTDSILNVEVFLRNHTGESAQSAVSLRLFDCEGGEIALKDNAQSADLAPGEDKTLSFAIPVSAPRKWSAEDPYLYALVLEEAAEGGTVYEAYRVGFRKITYKTTESGWWEDGPTDHDLIRINGKPIMFRGVDRHETHPELGYALTREVMEEDIRIMLENNINAVRTSHYPNNPYWYYLCDRYGIYVVDEANIECHSNMIAENARLTAYLSTAIIDREYSMIRRDRNHACVVMWSLGNENKNPEITRTILVDSYPDPEGVERVLHAYTRDRPWHYEQARDMYETGIDVRSGMYALPEELIAHGQADGPVPMIECEYEHAMGNSEGNFDEYWEAYDTYRNLQGGFIWDYIDQSISLTGENGERYFGYGGDYGERVHDSNFCANGLLLPDRTVQPEMAEVKYHYQQIKFADADAGHGLIQVKNFHLFTDIPDRYDVHWALLRNDTVLREGKVDESLLHIPPVDGTTNQPGTALIQLPVAWEEGDLRAGCAYFLNITVTLKQDAGLLKAGHTVAIEQFEITPDGDAPQEKTPEMPPVEMKRADGTVTVFAGDCAAVFDEARGMLTGYRVGDTDLIVPGQGPRANFFRAGTDNDRGFGYGLFVFTRPWKEAGEYRVTRFEVDESRADRAVVTVDGTYDGLNGTEVATVYTVYGNGAVACDYTIRPVYDKVYVYVPVVGMEMTVPTAFERMTYFGRGPEENYWDRQAGTKVGVYRTTVTDNFVPYVKSSETGNRTGVRWVALTDDNGFGLLATAGEEPMEMSALHCTAAELDRAVHPYELEMLSDTILRLNAVQIGVGGDNSWSRIVPHAQYLPHEECYHYSFILSPLLPGSDAMERSVALKNLMEHGY
ncbi:MAG: DUF4981 domain-containing protein [Clostridia bacterium]|nr:DUF4981 domain-containing protein [Clostridia bacterium]MBR4359265.1 DUF4981 domain-containing protein [Clostridia bacterium]